MFPIKECHVIANPAGHAPGYNYSLVGRIPTALLDKHPAKSADIMGGRAFRDTDGQLYTWKGRAWATAEEIKAAAAAAGVALCSVPTCACRKILGGGQ